MSRDEIKSKEQNSLQQLEKLLKKYNYFANIEQKKLLRIVQVYGFAFSIGCIAVLAEYFITHFIGQVNTFLFAIAAVTLSAWYGGFFAGLITIVCVTIGTDYFFVISYSTVVSSQVHFLVQLGMFIAVGIGISFLMQKSQKVKELDDLQKKEKDYADIIVYQIQAYEKAKAEIRSRDEFLSVASHELKTPLTSMLIKLQTALKNIRTVSLANFSIEKLMNMLESAEQQTIRLSKMINDLLNVSLITTGRIDLEVEEVDLKKLVESVIDRFSEKLKQEGYLLRLDVKEPVIGFWDKIRLEQIITNLLSNAIKYGNGKPIHITVEKNHSMACLIIEDQGIGISEEDQKRVFSLFERGVSSKDYKGLGIGLYITNQLVSAHKGKISLESSLGNGSKFILEFPYQSNG